MQTNYEDKAGQGYRPGKHGPVTMAEIAQAVIALNGGRNSIEDIKAELSRMIKECGFRTSDTGFKCDPEKVIHIEPEMRKEYPL